MRPDTAERRPLGKGGAPGDDGTSRPIVPADQLARAVWLLISDDRALWERVGLAREREAYQRGWADCLDYLADAIGGRITPARPAELEVIRWGPGGRAHFADPRPGDFPGRCAA